MFGNGHARVQSTSRASVSSLEPRQHRSGFGLFAGGNAHRRMRPADGAAGNSAPARVFRAGGVSMRRAAIAVFSN
jgi:hypothetical protein